MEGAKIKRTENVSDEYTVEYWRAEFRRLMDKVNNPRTLCSRLAQHDSYFETSTGAWAVSNAKKDKAGLPATRRVVMAMYQMLSAKPESPVAKRLARQRLRN